MEQDNSVSCDTRVESKTKEIIRGKEGQKQFMYI